MVPNRQSGQAGFTFVEVVVALALTVTIAGAIFALLTRGQEEFRREPEVSAVQQNARWGLEKITSDLALAGFKTPGAAAVFWNDGGGINPDEITIIYADPDVPISEPVKCGLTPGGGNGACKTIDNSSTLLIDPQTMDPYPSYPAQAYRERMILLAIETGDCNDDGRVGLYPFEVTQPPNLTNANGEPTLNINHNPGKATTELNAPGGFNRQVHPDCAVVGRFRVIQYRVSPFPTTPRPGLERRDLALSEPWSPVSANIENLQFGYATGNNPVPVDVPAPPNADDPSTWINRVIVTVAGRSESTHLQGASEGVFSPDDIHLRRSFSTSMNLRNVSFLAGSLTPTVP